MPEFVSIYANGDDGTVVTVTKAFAKSIKATVLEDEPAVDALGRPLEPRAPGAYENPPAPVFAPAIQLPDGTVSQAAAPVDEESETFVSRSGEIKTVPEPNPDPPSGFLNPNPTGPDADNA